MAETTMESVDQDCPCGNAIIRNGVTVKSHWAGKVCEDCEATMFQKFNAHQSTRRPFFPDLSAPDVVEKINLRHVEPLEGEADILFLRKGDRIQRWHVSHGGKSIVVVYIDRTEYLSEEEADENVRKGLEALIAEREDA